MLRLVLQHLTSMYLTIFNEILSIHMYEINKLLSELTDEDQVNFQLQERGIFFRAN